MVQKTSNRRIQAVKNNLKWMILGYLTVKNLGFWTNTEISLTVPKAVTKTC